MPRHDQYGTHDEHHGSPVRELHKHDERPRPKGRLSAARGRDYGSRDERDTRTSRDGRARFQGRDYERENYGGGYGVQHPSHGASPSAGRKDARVRRPPLREWRGQVGGSGMDGLASERAFGTENNEQMSALDTSDRAYRRWRQAELDAHDEEYRAWRRRQARRYDDDYARWKATRGRDD